MMSFKKNLLTTVNDVKSTIITLFENEAKNASFWIRANYAKTIPSVYNLIHKQTKMVIGMFWRLWYWK